VSQCFGYDPCFFHHGVRLWCRCDFQLAYACLEVCLSSFDKTLGSPLQGELASLVEFDALFDLPWTQGEYGLLH
jgi:hypothetical protein